MLSEPVSVRAQYGSIGAAPAATSLAFLAKSAIEAELPIARRRARVGNCRELSAADMVRNRRTGTVAVDAARREVTLDGEPLRAEPVERLAFSGSYLLG
jgi:urease subunit alpha